MFNLLKINDNFFNHKYILLENSFNKKLYQRGANAAFTTVL